MPHIPLTMENEEQYIRWLAEVNKAGHRNQKVQHQIGHAYIPERGSYVRIVFPETHFEL